MVVYSNYSLLKIINCLRLPLSSSKKMTKAGGMSSQKDLRSIYDIKMMLKKFDYKKAIYQPKSRKIDAINLYNYKLNNITRNGNSVVNKKVYKW